MRVLVVEDERRLASIIKRGLIEEGYAVDTVYDGEEAQYMAETTSYDIIILDIMLPKKDGIAVCKDRAKKINTPIMMFTARDSVEDRVKGLDSGADDYVIKPFAFSELLARIRALMRRESLSKTPKIQVGELTMDTLTRRPGAANVRLISPPKNTPFWNILCPTPIWSSPEPCSKKTPGIMSMTACPISLMYISADSAVK